MSERRLQKLHNKHTLFVISELWVSQTAKNYLFVAGYTRIILLKVRIYVARWLLPVR